MKVFSFGRTVAQPLAEPDAAEAAINRIARIEGRTQIITVHLGPGGRIGRHAAVVNQLLMVVAGAGQVSGGDGQPVDIGPGRAAFWVAGEAHETRTDSGLIGLIVESAALDPSATMPLA